MQIESLDVYILAGGHSSRFGSDKARALLAGQPLILHVQQELKSVSRSLTVVGRKPAQYADLGLECIPDLRADYGPLGGLYTALKDCQSQNKGPWILLASCDLWGVTQEQLKQLLEADRQGVQAIVWKHDFWEPLWALYHVSLIPELETCLKHQQLAMWKLLESIPVYQLEGSQLGWVQINRPADLARI